MSSSASTAKNRLLAKPKIRHRSADCRISNLANQGSKRVECFSLTTIPNQQPDVKLPPFLVCTANHASLRGSPAFSLLWAHVSPPATPHGTFSPTHDHLPIHLPCHSPRQGVFQSSTNRDSSWDASIHLFWYTPEEWHQVEILRMAVVAGKSMCLTNC